MSIKKSVLCHDPLKIWITENYQNIKRNYLQGLNNPRYWIYRNSLFFSKLILFEISNFQHNCQLIFYMIINDELLKHELST